MTSDAETPRVEARPGPWIAALRESHERLRSLAAPLTAEQLDSASYDSEWSIAQLLSHLGSGAEIVNAFLTAARDGTPVPGREAFPPIWDRWNAKAPRDQAADSVSSNERLLSDLEALDTGELSRIRLTLMGAETDVTGLVRMRLNEHAIHTWDVEVALDPTATIAPTPVELLIDGLGQMAGYAGRPSGLHANVRVRTSDPVREMALSIGDAVAITAWSGGEPTAELDLAAEALIRLLTGRLDPDHTGPVKVAGVTLADLRAVFPGY